MFGAGDPDNPMGGLLGDLLKVIGSAPGGGEAWFDAARTLAHGVATDGQDDDNADPLVRIAFEELARVAELHVANATGISLDQRRVAHLLRRRRPGAVVVPRPYCLPPHAAADGGRTATGRGGGADDHRPERARRHGGRARRAPQPVRSHAGPGAARHAVRFGRRPFGPAGFRAVRPAPALARVEHPPRRARQRGHLRRGLEPPAARGAAVGLPTRADHARRVDPTRASDRRCCICWATPRPMPPPPSGPWWNDSGTGWATRRPCRGC